MATVLAEELSVVKVGTAVRSERYSRRSKVRMPRAFNFRFEWRAERAKERKNSGNITVTSFSRVGFRSLVARSHHAAETPLGLAIQNQS